MLTDVSTRVKVRRLRRIKLENAEMKAETKKCDFDPLSLQGVLGPSRLVHAMKVSFGTPKCYANSGTKRDFSSHQPSRLIPELCDVFYSSHQCF